MGIITGLLFRVFLKRGASAVEETIGKMVRHGLTTWGGALMAEGIATADQVSLIAGGAVGVVGILASFARTWVQRKYG